MDYREELQEYRPRNEQEETDRETIFAYIRAFPADILTRDNIFAHMTASSMIFNARGDKVLMAYHNIFHSWSWTGGHADGEADLLAVALKEAKEETGVRTLVPLTEKPAAVDVLPVWGHVKRGRYVSAHQHLNFSYLLLADETEPLQVKADENSQVGWIPVEEIRERVSEPDMIPVYEKLIRAGQELLTKEKSKANGCERKANPL